MFDLTSVPVTDIIAICYPRDTAHIINVSTSSFKFINVNVFMFVTLFIGILDASIVSFVKTGLCSLNGSSLAKYLGVLKYKVFLTLQLRINF